MSANLPPSPAPWVVISGLDGSGKTTLVRRLARERGGHAFRLPYHDWVRPALRCSGDGTPFGDVHTDRLLLAADARLANNLIRRWRRQYPLLVSQRAWMDNFVFGAVQGVSYPEADAFLRTAELERPSAIVYLVADPEIAYERIRTDPNADKYETPEFLRVQYQETLRFCRAAQEGHESLAAFVSIPATLLDTSRLDEEAVYRAADAFLREHLPSAARP